LSVHTTWISRATAAPAQPGGGDAPLFTIATLVSDGAQYEEMLRSFEDGGFTRDCEYLALDNRAGNDFEAYGGIRLVLARARGRHVIVCHQDVRLIKDGRRELLARLEELELRDPLWALAGNAGGTGRGIAKRISDPHGEDQHAGDLPERALSLDENFIVINRSSMIAPSADLAGFHLYGTDLCLQARMRGHGAYVINYHLRHLGRGTIGRDYYHCLEALEDKYARVLQPGSIQTTCLAPTISASSWRLALARFRRLRKKLKKLRIERQAKAAKSKG
jgi:hypothetical protein